MADAASRGIVAFGPVPSRRLGWSLGVNNVPAKTCSYACVYCQVGATDRARLGRTTFLDPDLVVAAVRNRLATCLEAGRPVDYVSFVPDGEPTLDAGLGREIREIRGLRTPVAVLTNASLLWRDDVCADLAAADWVSVKVDTVDEMTWRRLNRPIGGLSLGAVLAGIRRFAATFRGMLVTETMLVAGVNDDQDGIRRVAAFVSALTPARAYVAVPTRPPAETWVTAPAPQVVWRASESLRAAEVPVTCLADEPDLPFPCSSSASSDLLGIVAVHPMTDTAARDYLARSGADWAVVERLVREGRIALVTHAGRTYLQGVRPGRAWPPPGRARG